MCRAKEIKNNNPTGAGAGKQKIVAAV